MRRTPGPLGPKELLKEKTGNPCLHGALSGFKALVQLSPAFHQDWVVAG